MDIILTRFSEQCLAGLSEAELDLYDALLEENDQDLYQWVTGQVPPPERFVPVLEKVVATLPKSTA